MGGFSLGVGPASIDWRECYSVGNQQLDNQHQEILLLVNRLYEALSMDEEEDVLPTIVRRLANYVSSHFQDEERVMQESGFAGLDEHRRIHKDLGEKTSDLLFACIQKDPPQAKEVLRFLKGWWIDHISGEDGKYASFLESRQTEESSSQGIDHELEELLEALIENEKELGRYYSTMADFVPEHGATWELLSRQEYGHATVLQEVRRAAAENPHLFSAAKYSPATIRVAIREIRQMIDKMERGEVHPQYAVTFIADMEQSLLDSQVDKAVKTDVVEVQNSLKRLSEQTSAHRELLRSISTSLVG